jgi:short-subunit dehydrogenase
MPRERPGETFPLRGSVSVVTGAAGGIGRALALQLAGEGVDLALVDIDAVALEATARAAREFGRTVSTHLVDTGDAAAVAGLPEAVLARHGRVALLINNAGVALMGSFDELTLADIEWLFAINFWGVVRMTKAFLPALRREPTAHIVNLSSVFGIIAPPGQTAYSASKFAVRGFSEALRHELAGSRIGLSVVHPGGIATSIAENARVAAGIAPETAKQAAAQFKTLARTTPEAAAARILAGIRRREKRILIGADARVIAAVQRVFPVSYWNLFRRFNPR